MRAAMTGHLVLSTIHTEDTVSAIDRLKDMGVEPYLIAGAVRGVISQRLVRRICPNCREEVQPSDDLLDLTGMDREIEKAEKEGRKISLYRGRGCHMCFDSGYRGRIGVFEILPINANLRDRIGEGQTGSQLRRTLQADPNFVPMIVNGRDLAMSGTTTVDELVRTIITVE